MKEDKEKEKKEEKEEEKEKDYEDEKEEKTNNKHYFIKRIVHLLLFQKNLLVYGTHSENVMKLANLHIPERIP